MLDLREGDNDHNRPSAKLIEESHYFHQRSPPVRGIPDLYRFPTSAKIEERAYTTAASASHKAAQTDRSFDVAQMSGTLIGPMSKRDNKLLKILRI